MKLEVKISAPANASCETCRYSRTERFFIGNKLEKETIFCYVRPPVALDEYTVTRQNVTDRPAICGKYVEESPEELFDDLDLERMLPQEPVSKHQRRRVAKAPFDKTTVAYLPYAQPGESHLVAYKTFSIFQSKGYPLTDKIIQFMSKFEQSNPHLTPDWLE